MHCESKFDFLAGHVFPEEFYTFLKGFFAKFAGAPVMTPDEKILRYVPFRLKENSLITVTYTYLVQYM